VVLVLIVVDKERFNVRRPVSPGLQISNTDEGLHRQTQKLFSINVFSMKSGQGRGALSLSLSLFLSLSLSHTQGIPGQ
jgi:hypothetical protein